MWKEISAGLFRNSSIGSKNLIFCSDTTRCRKLLAVDYLGAALTLAGCTLVLLPLIWVSDMHPKRAMK